MLASAGEMISGPKRALFMDEISTGLDSRWAVAVFVVFLTLLTPSA